MSFLFFWLDAFLAASSLSSCRFRSSFALSSCDLLIGSAGCPRYMAYSNSAGVNFDDLSFVGFIAINLFCTRSSSMAILKDPHRPLIARFVFLIFASACIFPA